MERKFGTIIQIGDILVSEDVVTEFFACDYETCRGVCCIEGDSGAPMEEDEPGLIERDYPKFSALMSEKGRLAAESSGFFEIDRDGDMVTPLVKDSCECAFCHFGPSCSLYPIRVTRLTGGSLALNVHHWDICRPAFEKGRREGIPVYRFLRKPLEERFGEEFWSALDAAARHLLSD